LFTDYRKIVIAGAGFAVLLGGGIAASQGAWANTAPSQGTRANSADSQGDTPRGANSADSQEDTRVNSADSQEDTRTNADDPGASDPPGASDLTTEVRICADVTMKSTSTTQGIVGTFPVIAGSYNDKPISCPSLKPDAGSVVTVTPPGAKGFHVKVPKVNNGAQITIRIKGTRSFSMTVEEMHPL
jgi:hypothetical protein